MEFNRYTHLENICNIQQTYISGKINQEEFFKQLDEENERHLLCLKKENQKIKQKITTENNKQKIKQDLQETKVYKMSIREEKYCPYCNNLQIFCKNRG